MKKFITVISMFLLISNVAICKDRNLVDENYRRNTLGVFFDTQLTLSVTENGVSEEVASFLKEFEISDKFDNLPSAKDNRGAGFINLSGVNVDKNDILLIDPRYFDEKKSGSFLSLLGAETQSPEQQKIAAQHEFLRKHLAVVSATTEDEYNKNTTLKAAKMLKWLKNCNVANKLIASWFGGDNGNAYNVDLIKERGHYNASELDKLEALDSKRGLAIVEDAGEELIGHTFITFTDFEIIDGRRYEERSKQLLANSYGTSSKFGKMLQESSDKSANETAGFYITSTTYLFKLNWNEEIANRFYSEFWEQPVSALMNSDLCSIEYIGFERNTTKTTQDINGKGLFNKLKNHMKREFSSGRIFERAFAKNENEKKVIEARQDRERYAENEKIRMDMTTAMTKQSLIRSVDQTFADLMKNHEEFRVKAPILEVEDGYITAFIGLKEGLKDNSEFEILEPRINDKTNKIEYHKVGKAKVDKKRLWDNRYTIIDDEANIRGKGDNAYELDRTYLKCSSKNVVPGMLLYQIK